MIKLQLNPLPQRILNPIQYLLSVKQPWVRYNTLLNLEKIDVKNPKFLESKSEMLEHPKIQELIQECINWPGKPLIKHNDAGHLIQNIALLADFGLKHDDPGLDIINR